jgi:hypothetical protein
MVLGKKVMMIAQPVAIVAAMRVFLITKESAWR